MIDQHTDKIVDFHVAQVTEATSTLHTAAASAVRAAVKT